MKTFSALPARFAAGTTVKYTRSHADFPASQGWGLKLHIAGAEILAVDGVVSGDSFVFTLTAAMTASFPPGPYQWIERAKKASDEYDAAAGQVTITRNLATAAKGDAQSDSEKMLASAKAALSALIEGRVQTWQVGIRTFSKLDLPELKKLVVELEARVARERNGGVLSGRKHLMAFRPTSGG